MKLLVNNRTVAWLCSVPCCIGGAQGWICTMATVVLTADCAEYKLEFCDALVLIIIYIFF